MFSIYSEITCNNVTLCSIFLLLYIVTIFFFVSFDSFEGGDELDHEENADTAVSSSAGNVLQQRRVNARNINTTSRRKAKVNFCHTPVDLLSTILDQQEKWHNPKSTFHSNR